MALTVSVAGYARQKGLKAGAAGGRLVGCDRGPIYRVCTANRLPTPTLYTAGARARVCARITS